MLSMAVSDARTWYKILGLCAFNLFVSWLLLGIIDPEPRHRLSTIEVFACVVMPAIFFYLRTDWRPLCCGASLLGIAVVAVFTYSVLHEGSHVLGLYALGSAPTKAQLIPRYWKGEFTTGAFVASKPLEGWLGAIPGVAPYIKDVIFALVGAWILHKRNFKSAFLAGLAYVILCLVPLFDVVNNYSIMLFLGEVPGNDFYGTALRWGPRWTHVVGVAFSVIVFAACACVLFFQKKRPSP